MLWNMCEEQLVSVGGNCYLKRPGERTNKVIPKPTWVRETDTSCAKNNLNLQKRDNSDAHGVM